MRDPSELAEIRIPNEAPTRRRALRAGARSKAGLSFKRYSLPAADGAGRVSRASPSARAACFSPFGAPFSLANSPESLYSASARFAGDR